MKINMWYIIIGIIVLGVIAAIAGYFRNKKLQQMLERGEISEIPEAREIPEECCGQHETCERDSLLAAVSKRLNIMMTRNWIVSGGWREMSMKRMPSMSSARYFIPCSRKRWPGGSVACNFVA